MADTHLIASKRLIQEYEPLDRTKHRNLFFAPESAHLIIPALLLRGYAIEDLLKAIWLRSGQLLFDEGEMIAKVRGISAHRLHEIASAVGKTAGFEMESSELRLLRRLTHFLRVSGRYPVAMNYYEEMPITEDRGSGEGRYPPGGWFPDSDESLFHEILEKLRFHHGALKYHGDRR